MRRFVKLLALNGLVVEANKNGGGNDKPFDGANAISQALLASGNAPGKMCSIRFHFSPLYWDFSSSSKQELLVDVKECLAVHTSGHKNVKAGPFTLDSRGNPTVTCWLKRSGIYNSQGKEEPRILGTYTIESKPVTDPQTPMTNDWIGHAETKGADSKPNFASLKKKLCASFFLRWKAELSLLKKK